MLARRTIIVDARTIRTVPGGVATYTQELIRWLPGIFPNVPFVLLRHPERSTPLSEADNVRELTLGDRPHNPWTFFRMGRWLNERFDSSCLFHAPYRILPRNSACHTVMTAHDLMQVVCPELVFPNRWTRPALSAYWRFTVLRSLRSAGRVISVSDYTKQDIARQTPSAKERTRTIPLAAGAFFTPITPTDALSRTRHLVSSESPFFLVLGGGYANKNHVAAIRAFAEGFENSNARLLIVQRERTLAPEIRFLLEKHQVASRVEVTGRVSNDELVALYNRATALVFPSLYEGFGLPVLEAMACGCPVVASNRTSIPEVAGDAALLCDPDDTPGLARLMGDVLNDRALRGRLIEKGSARVAEFSWKKVALATARVYRELVPWLPEVSG